jgi:transcriptional regulator with XRE-family HTH domain
MVAVISITTAQQQLALECQKARIASGLTQEGLSYRADVALSTLRKFEQKGLISLEAFLRIAMVLGLLESFVNAVKTTKLPFNSMEELLAADKKPQRKRGWRT